MYQAPYRTQEYRQNEVSNASPLHLVVMAYDLAIQACEKKEFEKAVHTISVLRDALDFDYPEVSLGLFRLYQWCLECIRSGDYNSAASVMIELRDAWRTTEKNLARQTAAASTSAYASVAAHAA